jgi:enhancing lycopene biosynthesis protein 2
MHGQISALVARGFTALAGAGANEIPWHASCAPGLRRVSKLSNFAVNTREARVEVLLMAVASMLMERYTQNSYAICVASTPLFTRPMGQ